jgi:hypothetical protein
MLNTQRSSLGTNAKCFGFTRRTPAKNPLLLRAACIATAKAQPLTVVSNHSTTFQTSTLTATPNSLHITGQFQNSTVQVR